MWHGTVLLLVTEVQPIASCPWHFYFPEIARTLHTRNLALWRNKPPIFRQQSIIMLGVFVSFAFLVFVQHGNYVSNVYIYIWSKPFRRKTKTVILGSSKCFLDSNVFLMRFLNSDTWLSKDMLLSEFSPNGLILCYSHLVWKDYDSIVKLVETLEKLPTFDLASHHHVKFHYAFALNR